MGMAARCTVADIPSVGMINTDFYPLFMMLIGVVGLINTDF